MSYIETLGMQYPLEFAINRASSELAIATWLLNGQDKNAETSLVLDGFVDPLRLASTGLLEVIEKRNGSITIDGELTSASELIASNALAPVRYTEDESEMQTIA